MARWWRNYSSVLHTIYSIQWLYLWAYVQNISHLLRSQSLIKQFKAISNILRDNIYVRQDRTFTCFPNPTHRCKPMIYVCKLIKEKWIFPGCVDSQSDPSWIIEFFNGHTERFTFFFVIKLRKRHNLNTQPPRNLTTNMSLLSICWTVLVAKCCLNIGWQFPCGNSKPYNFFFLLHFFYFVTEYCDCLMVYILSISRQWRHKFRSVSCAICVPRCWSSVLVLRLTYWLL